MPAASLDLVLANLLDNAIKYAAAGGVIRLAVLAAGEAVVVQVSDAGPGIAQDELPHLFERFYRVDRARSRDKGGTGLGLAIAKHIVEAHKQTISVDSAVGLGTTFSFTLLKPAQG